MLTGLPAPGRAVRTDWARTRRPPQPTPAQETAHTAAYGAYMDHAGTCPACWAEERCDTCTALYRALREAGR
jgi:hypothetical protein